MKSTIIVAISLVLFALVLILGAAFFFDSVDRGRFMETQEAIRANQQDEMEEISTREANAQRQANEAQETATAVFSDLQEIQLQSTAIIDSLHEEQAGKNDENISAISTLEAENLIIEEELANVAQVLETRELELIEATSKIADLDQINKSFENQEPFVIFVSPQEDAQVNIGDSIELVVVASHPVEVTGIEIHENNFPIAACESEMEQMESGPLAILRCSWEPSEIGEFTLNAFAKSANKTSQDNASLITITVVEVDETAAPENEEFSP